MSRSNNSLVLKAIEGEVMPEELTYQGKLRMAIYDGVKEADVADVVKAIVAKAKEGDSAAQKMLFEYVLGGKTQPTSITVNNHFSDVEQGAAVAGKGRKGNA